MKPIHPVPLLARMHRSPAAMVTSPASKHPQATIKPESKPAAGTPALRYYDKITARINKLAREIAGVPARAARVAPNKATVRVSAAITAAVVAQKNAGQTKAEIKAQLLAALDRAFA